MFHKNHNNKEESFFILFFVLQYYLFLIKSVGWAHSVLPTLRTVFILNKILCILGRRVLSQYMKKRVKTLMKRNISHINKINIRYKTIFLSKFSPSL